MSGSALFDTFARAPLSFERGEGSWLVADNGQRYLDFGAGIAVNSLGYSHPHLVAALTEQAGKLWHVSNLYEIPGQRRLAERLVAATFADKVFFTNSGAEAIEASDQDRAPLSLSSTAIPNASAPSPSKAPSTAARWRRSLPAARRNTSKASARRPTASTRSPSTTSMPPRS